MTVSEFIEIFHILSTPSPYPLYRCPERHFGWNQLPGSSIGLSPLSVAHVIELNIRMT